MERAGTISAAQQGGTVPSWQAGDALTGLAGREALDGGGGGARRSVLLVDLDQFKAINDTYGHANGDRVLREVGRRLRAVAGAHLPVRVSGDEFAVVVSSGSRSACQRLAEEIHRVIRAPIELDGGSLLLEAGIGIALSHGELTLWELISRAGASLRPLKRSGRLPRIVVYDDAQHGQILDTLALSLDLRAAVARNELVMQYQPLVDMASRHARGFEALVRWVHPIRGVVAPQRFVPLAEDRGLMPELGEWVLTEACLQARSWESRTGEIPYVSVNISIRQLEDPEFETRFERALGISGLDPGRLRVEVTESVLAGGLSVVRPRLEAVRATGAGVLLDDFGTGYSSLAYLRELPLDGVKLDRVFTRDLTTSSEAWSLARSIVTMISHLDLDLIAEGLETAAHLAQLRSLGCQMGQGFFFGRPERADRLRFEGLGRPLP